MVYIQWLQNKISLETIFIKMIPQKISYYFDVIGEISLAIFVLELMCLFLFF